MKPSPQSDGRIPVIIAGLDGISGVSAWSFRLREALAHHPRYQVVLINCRETGNRIGTFDCTAADQAAMADLLRHHAPAIVVPNFIWPIFDVCANLINEGVPLRCLGFCRADSDTEYYNPLTWYEPLITRFAAVSPECAARLAECVEQRRGDIVTMPTGVTVPDSLARPYQTAPLRLVYGGRIVQAQKRVLDFVPLVELLLARDCDFVLDIVGQGRQLGELKHAMANLNHGGRVRFLGKVTPAAMDAIWRDHDVFLQCSDFEGTSNSMLESMAQGTIPVVTQTESGLAGIIEPGLNGFLVPVGDLEAMADMLCGLTGSATRLEALGRAAHETARAYSIEAYADRFVMLLDEIMTAPLRSWPSNRASETRPPIEGLDLPETAMAASSIVSRVAGWAHPADTVPDALPENFTSPETLVLVAASDENFVMPLAAMVKSVLHNLAPDRTMVLYIIDGGIEADSRKRLLDSWPGERLTVRWLHPEWALLNSLKLSGHVNALTYARLLIPRLLPAQHTRAIYLDSDIIVLADLGALWDHPPDDRHLLAVQDMTAPWMCSATSLPNFPVCGPYLSAAQALGNFDALGIPPRTKYFNAGLLVFNLTKWRQSGADQTVIDYLHSHSEHVRWWDQDGLNAILFDQWGEIDLCWNQIPHIFRYPSWRESPFCEADYEAITTRPKAIHFSARSKPWHGDNTHPFRDAFFHYLDQTVWTGWRPEAPLELVANGDFSSWTGAQPAHWSLSPGAVVEPATESRIGGNSLSILPPKGPRSTGLEQRLATPPELAGARLSIHVDGRCHDRRALALNVHITIGGRKKTYSTEHPGHGAWATLRHEIDIPPGQVPDKIQCLVVLRACATAPALVEGLRCLAFPPAPDTAEVDWTVPGTIDLRRPARYRAWNRWNPLSWVRTAMGHQGHRSSRGQDKTGLPETNRKPMFSVILSNYNGAEFLEEALRSVAEQDYASFEFIIVDDASTDNSRILIESIAREFPERVRTLFKERNEGQAAGFNDGYALASGDIIAFMDSDDRWFPDKLTKLARLVESAPGCAIYQHNLYTLVNGTVTEEKFRDVVQTGDLLAYTKRTRHFPYFVPTSGLAFSRIALDQVMPIPNAFRVCADGFLTRTILCFGPIASTNECWGAYRVHDGNNVFGNPDHDTFAYTNGLLIPTLNAFYQANGIDLSFEIKTTRKNTKAELAPRVKATNRSLVTKILDSSIRELLRELRRRLPFG